jgi:hypothetical protein
MTPEEHQLLTETRQLVEENAVILRGIQKHQRMTSAVKAVYWIVVIALSFGAYYLIQPYVNTLKASVSDITGGSSVLGQ